jgi:excinuclease ABC subunit A
VDQGNTVLVIEHNLDVIKTADWIVDMGPEGGSRGGMVVAEGTPEEVAANPGSYTGQFLAPLVDGRGAQVAASADSGRRTKKSATPSTRKKSSPVPVSKKKATAKAAKRG